MLTESITLLRDQALAGDDVARAVYADALESAGNAAAALEQRERIALLEQIRTDTLPKLKRRARVDRLTQAEVAAMPEWAERWIRIGLSTERTDRPLFETAATACYRRCNLPPPRFAWCESPIVAVMAGAIWSSFGAELVDSQVYSQVRSQVRSQDFRLPAEWVKAARANWTAYLGGQFWVGWYWGNAAIMFFLDRLRLDIGRDLELGARAYAACARSACWWYPTSSVVFVSERPHTLERHADGRLKRVAWEGWEVAP